MHHVLQQPSEGKSVLSYTSCSCSFRTVEVQHCTWGEDTWFTECVSLVQLGPKAVLHLTPFLPNLTKISLSPHEEGFGLALIPLSRWQKWCHCCHMASLHGLGCEKWFLQGLLPELKLLVSITLIKSVIFGFICNGLSLFLFLSLICSSFHLWISPHIIDIMPLLLSVLFAQ